MTVAGWRRFTSRGPTGPLGLTITTERLGGQFARTISAFAISSVCKWLLICVGATGRGLVGREELAVSPSEGGR